MKTGDLVTFGEADLHATITQISQSGRYASLSGTDEFGEPFILCSVPVRMLTPNR